MRKSDKVDSKAIAEVVRLDALPQSYITPSEIAVLHEKARRRAFLVRVRDKLMSKIRGVLAYKGVKPSGGCRVFSKKVRGLVWWLPFVSCFYVAIWF